MRRGTRVGQAYIALTADGSGINDDIADSMDDADFDSIGEEHGREYGDGFGDGSSERMERARDNIASALRDRLDMEGVAAGDSTAARFVERFRAQVGNGGNGGLIDSMFSDDDIDRVASRFGERIGDAFGDRLDDALAREFSNIESHLMSLRSLTPSSNSGNGQADSDFGSQIGRVLGAGSRNNFLNLFGRSIGGAVGLVNSLGKSAKGMFTTFQTGFQQAGAGASIFTKLLGGMGATGASAFSSLAASGPAVAIGLGVAILAASVLVSVLSALLAIATALASTIVSGIVAAALVGAGALTAMAAAGGLLAVAFTSMTDAQRDVLKADFQPLKAELTGLGQLMITQMIPYFATWSANLQNALALAAPVASVMGDAFGRAGQSLTAAFSGPGFQEFMRVLAIELPGITENLSLALGGFLNGLLGVFAVLMPYVSRFALYLAKVSDNFSDWANSAEGRNAIVDFTDRALVSLESLWNFVQEFSGFVGDVLFSPDAQGAGNTLFDALTRAFQGFRRAIADGSLESWFADAIAFAHDLKDAIAAMADVIDALYSSGTLEAVGSAISSIASAISWVVDVGSDLHDWFNDLPGWMQYVLNPLQRLVDTVTAMGNAVVWVLDLMGQVDTGSFIELFSPVLAGPTAGSGTQYGPTVPTGPGDPGFIGPVISGTAQNLINAGNAALDATGVDNGGNKSDKYKNPYARWAQQFIDQGPSMVAQVKAAVRQVNKMFKKAIADAAKADSLGEARSIISGAIESARSVADSMVDAARGALSNAAQTLASASSAGEAAKALAALRKAQDGLALAIKRQNQIEKAMNRLGNQKDVSQKRVDRLMDGLRVQNATLADYAVARARVTSQLEKANKRLVDAIALRDQYKTQVTAAVEDFGSLMTASAKTVNGVEQALTATDITDNLRDRLAKIRAFQADLRKLLALGLSNDAYKQLVDAGVEDGSAYAAALVAGGSGAVGQVNQLTGQINGVAEQLGSQVSQRLYQAGVDAARGLVDGLESLSGQLDRAATRLGNAIVNAIKKALDSHSPSRKMIKEMDNVGDGLEIGLDNQGNKVAAAASRLSGKIAVSPEVAEYEATQRRGGGVTAGVTGKYREDHWHISTPTDNPKGVAREMINEMTGRL